MEKPKTFQGDLTHLPPALAPLTQEPRWLNWRWVWRTRKDGTGKWTKPPYQSRSPDKNASSTDPGTWGQYADAVEVVAEGAADGIGFALLGSNIGAVDLDHCRDADSGAISPWAEDIRAQANGSYCEVTVSGTGLRIISQVANETECHRKFTVDRATDGSIEIYRNCARYITVSGLEIGHCTDLPPADDFLDKLDSRYDEQSDGGFDFNTAGEQTTSSIDYDDLIKNGAPEGQRSELFQAVVWHLAGQGWTAEQITDELTKHPNGIGSKYADRLYSEVVRSYKKWRGRRRASATGTATANAPWPQIRVSAGELPRVVDEAEAALLTLGREFYQRGGLVVRPVVSRLKAADDRDTQSWRLVPVTRPHLVEMLTRAAQFVKWDGRAKKFTPADAPQQVAETYLERQGDWKLPPLVGIVNTPFLRVDGSICETPGYDAASDFLFKPDDESFPPVPMSPDKVEAREALAQLDQLLDSFPFVAAADRSVALSAMLTTLDRRAMATAPLHAFTAPTAGTGKSLLVDMIAMLATRRLMPVIAQGRTEEELEKRLGAALLAGDVAISLDNCEQVLQSSFLCQALTQRQLNIRMLGRSRNVETPVNAVVFATGNNLVFAGDLTRRVLLASLDAKCERPELRSFTVDPIETIRRNRGALVVAALTVLRAWHIAKSFEKLTLSAFGSFEDWSHRVREPLVWLDYADPCDTIRKIRNSDPQLEALGAVIEQWRQNMGIQNASTVQQLINRALSVTEFHAALMAVAVGRNGQLSNERLGRWLKKVQDKIINGFAISRAGIASGYPLWVLLQK